MTPSERELWKYVRHKQILGYGFRRQFVIAGFIIDFYCPQLKLGIEVDGDIHDLEESKVYDQNRELALKQYGVTLIHIKNQDIQGNIQNVLSQIITYIQYSPPYRR